MDDLTIIGLGMVAFGVITLTAAGIHHLWALRKQEQAHRRETNTLKKLI